MGQHSGQRNSSRKSFRCGKEKLFPFHLYFEARNAAAGIIVLGMLCCTLSACSVSQENPLAQFKSQNAIDAMLEPHTDMRDETPRSQESPNRLRENESEEEGSISRGRST